MQVGETSRPVHPATGQAEDSLKRPWPVVLTENRPMQPYDQKVAVVTDRQPVEVEKHVKNIEAGHIEPALKSALQVKHTAVIENESVENKCDKEERTLVTTESSKAADIGNQHRAHPEVATELEDERTVKSRPSPELLPVGKMSRALVSSDQSSQPLATLSDRTLTQPVSEPPVAPVGESHPVTSQAHEQALVVLSPNSAPSDGAINVVDGLKTSAIQAVEHSADDTGAFAAACGRDVDIAPSTETTTPAHNAAAVESPDQRISVTTSEGPPMSSRAGGSSSSEVKKRTGSVDVFFTPTSPVVVQGSKDLISFNSEPSVVPSAKRSAEKRTNTETFQPNVPPANDDANKVASCSSRRTNHMLMFRMTDKRLMPYRLSYSAYCVLVVY